ncbi:hypothetical protein PGB90_005494 [Kerria lacca]
MKKNRDDQDDQANQTLKINELEQSNRVLQEKLKLLRIQLESQTQLQIAAFSHSRSASLNRARTNLHTYRNYHSTNGLKTEDCIKSSEGKNYESISYQLKMFQEEFDRVKEQYKNHIKELEEQLEKNRNVISPTKLKIELNENVELIKLKRLSKKQAAQIISLQSQLEISNSEIKLLQNNLSSLNIEKDNLREDLSNEKCEITKLLSDISTLKENNTFLEEQLKDLKAEKETLKKYNENLLQLSLKKRDSTCNDSETKTHFLKQIKDLEENVRKEVIAKCELSSKLSDAELLNVKLKTELTKNNVIVSEVQAINLSQKIEIEKLKDKLLNIDSNETRKRRSLSTENKSVMTLTTDAQLLSDKDDASNITSINDRMESNTKMQLCKTSRELSQCKELLRVQYGLNSKYKMEIEELQKIFQKNEKLTSDHLRNFQIILRKHENQLSHIVNINISDFLQSIINNLNKIFSVKKLGSFQDYISCIDKLLEGYVLFIQNSFLKSNASTSKKDATVITTIDYDDKFVQVDSNQKHDIKSKDNNDIEEVISSINKLQDAVLNLNFVIFELRIEKATFSNFSEHLMKSTDKNPRVFLTWNFLNDAEHQAYTPTISVDKGIFNCSCQYEGPWSEFLYQYLKQHGIRIEIHLVQGDISVRLAEALIDTSASLINPNEYQLFISNFQNDNIEGTVSGNYILKCDETVVKLVNVANSMHK